MLTRRSRKKQYNYLRWNAEVKPGDVITGMAVLIAFFALLYQRKDLITKVDDLQTVVNKLEEEKRDRELQGTLSDVNRLKTFSLAMRMSSDQIENLSLSDNTDFMESYSEFNDLSRIIEAHNHLNSSEKVKLHLLKEENSIKVQLHVAEYETLEKQAEFRKNFMPRQEQFRTEDDFINAQRRYNDTLEGFINVTLIQLDALTKSPLRKLQQVRDSLMIVSGWPAIKKNEAK